MFLAKSKLSETLKLKIYTYVCICKEYFFNTKGLNKNYFGDNININFNYKKP